MTDKETESQPSAQVAESVQPAPDNEEKLFAAIGYIAFLFIVPLIVKPKSKYCQLHAKQSLVMFLITFVYLIVFLISEFIGSILTVALFALYVLAIYRSFRGDWWKIPFVGDVAEHINLSMLLGAASGAAGHVGGLQEKAQEVAKKVTNAAHEAAQQEPDDKK
ncbi:MAG: hypothetical protein AAB592_01565 [Patescibacteria group bacterium]